MTIDPRDFEFIRKLVRERSAVVIDFGKEYLVESRLARILRARKIPSLGDLVSLLRAAPGDGLCEEVVEAMTTNETSFFRDQACFALLQDKLIPELLAARPRGERLTIWSCACSSGQEPYSLALLLHEMAGQLAGRKVAILATDVCESMLLRARQGIYDQLEVSRGLPASMLARHFVPRGRAWQVKPEIRALIEFRRLNLAGLWPALPHAGLVLLRNVMIYFDVATRQRVLQHVERVLEPGGYLILGSAETMFKLDSAFERRTAGGAAFYTRRSA
ncbi:MAG: protein-glutamate O-methyltransferase CheR [Planctomycetes bacterium]|nr:protein-glutamate O-methyltransferase CheR [Planctomycetota bacterium]